MDMSCHVMRWVPYLALGEVNMCKVMQYRRQFSFGIYNAVSREVMGKFVVCIYETICYETICYDT